MCVLGDCKPSEVKSFIADYLEKVVEPCDWLALWSTDVFDVLVEVRLTYTFLSQVEAFDKFLILLPSEHLVKFMKCTCYICDGIRMYKKHKIFKNIEKCEKDQFSRAFKIMNCVFFAALPGVD